MLVTPGCKTSRTTNNIGGLFMFSKIFLILEMEYRERQKVNVQQLPVGAWKHFKKPNGRIDCISYGIRNDIP
jgi:hypothetical protein